MNTLNSNGFSLLSGCTSGGCGAKIGPGELAETLGKLPAFTHPSLLVGYATSDDAAVYKINDDKSIVSTVDFFSPMVEDAASFGRIAAANAMSDVWAMGGVPVMALNLLCVPQTLPQDILTAMLKGGAEKIREAGAVLGGGHSIYDKELKYGLAVTGTVPTGRILRNNTPAPGDKLILTKALGTGLVLSALRADLAGDEPLQAAINSMERLNRYAAEKMAGYTVSACTDVTGFGLLVHAAEMAGQACTIALEPDALPALPEAKAYAGQYLLTAAGQRNRNHMRHRADVEKLPFEIQELLFDPQTSGGLLIAVSPAQAAALQKQMAQDDPAATIIGEMRPKADADIVFI